MPNFAPLAALAHRLGVGPLVQPDATSVRTAEDWTDLFEERAAILEYDGGWSREEAERRAREEIASMRFGRK